MNSRITAHHWLLGYLGVVCAFLEPIPSTIITVKGEPLTIAMKKFLEIKCQSSKR
jgi:hypothetical protein